MAEAVAWLWEKGGALHGSNTGTWGERLLVASVQTVFLWPECQHRKCQHTVNLVSKSFHNESRLIVSESAIQHVRELIQQRTPKSTSNMATWWYTKY